MSKYFQIVKRNYDRGFWTIQQVKYVVVMGLISEYEYEYELITGEDYDGSSKTII
jgi:hypothetical protein